jgi:MFS superfamily sulfate permease-like transporter
MTTLSATTRLSSAIAARDAAPGLRFTLSELSGSLGDLGTFLPLAAAMAAMNQMNLSVVFLFAGVMNIASGLLFRQPIPVQPMKAIAAVAIAEGLSPGAIAASGITMGVVMTVLAVIGAVSWIDHVVPTPVIRGIQAGVGAKLVLAGAGWITALPLLGMDSVTVAAIFMVGVAVSMRRRIPVLLIVFLIGLGVAAFELGQEHRAVSWGFAIAPIVPTGQQWITGVTRGAVGQLPLTLLNSVLAVCALSGDLYPGKGVTPRRMALSVGLMNLLTTPFGAMPMCHGAGGLAAQHHFGARTGGSVVMLGAGKIIFALALGGMLLPLVQAYPRSLLAVMIIFAGVTLMKPARESMRDGTTAMVMITTASVILFAGVLEGFLAGCAAAALLAGLAHVRGERS